MSIRGSALTPNTVVKKRDHSLEKALMLDTKGIGTNTTETKVEESEGTKQVSAKPTSSNKGIEEEKTEEKPKKAQKGEEEPHGKINPKHQSRVTPGLSGEEKGKIGAVASSSCMSSFGGGYSCYKWA